MVLEKALTLLDLLIGGPAFFFVELESTSVLCLPIDDDDDDDAEAVVGLLLLLEDLKADTAILSYLLLYVISNI